MTVVYNVNIQCCYMFNNLLYLEKVRQSYNLENIVEEFKENRNITENCMERRHQENMQMRKQFLETFEKMIDILKKK